jgi:metacaspase-1
MTKKIVLIAVAVFLTLSFMLPGIASSNQPLKVDKHKPVIATDVELATKIMVEKGKPPTKPAKPGASVATGILGTTVEGNKYAIVVGISDYPGTSADLGYADDDAEDMYSALTTLYSFNQDNITKYVNLEATRDKILTAIESISNKATSADEVVFFFSGHGGRGKANDGDIEKIDECIWAHDGTSLVPIWDGELAAAFAGYTTSRIVFIFDSCYAGGMTDLRAPGRVVAMATTETTLGYESATLGNGEFTYYLVDQGMLAGLADKYDHNANGSLLEPTDVTVEEGWDYAKANCQSNTPTISDSFDNDLMM